MKSFYMALLVFSTVLSLYAGDTGKSSSNAGTTGTTTSTSGDTVGDPVGIADGAVYDAVTDIRVPCPDVDLVFRRSYGSWSQHEGSLGVGWTHSYDWRVETNASEVCVFSAGETDVTDGVHKFHPAARGGSVLNEDGYELRCSEGGLFSLVTPRKSTYAFDAEGRLSRIETWNGSHVSLSRDVASGFVVGVTHSCGKSLSFMLDGGGSIVRVSSPDPSVWTEYVYSSNAVEKAVGTKLLVGVVRHDGVRTSEYSYEYEAVKRPGTLSLVAVSNAAGGWFGNAASTAQSSGSGGGLSVPSSGGGSAVMRVLGDMKTCCVLSRKTDPNGMSTSYKYLRMTDSAFEKCVRTEMTDGLFAVDLSYEKNRTNVSRETAFGRLLEFVYFDDKSREVRRNAGDETRNMTYDSRDDLVRIVETNRTSRHACTSVFEYDSRHRIVSFANALDAEPSRFATFAWDELSGEPNRVVTPAGRVSEYLRGDFSYVLYGAGTNDSRLVSSISCDEQWHPVSIVDPDGAEMRLSRDSHGLVSRVERDGLPSMDICHDMLGHASSLSLPGPGAATRTVLLVNNWRGKPLSMQWPDGTAESFAYDGNGTTIVRHIDQLGREDAYKWVLGLPVHAGRVIGGVTNTLFGVEHDKHLNVVSITDPLRRKAESYALDANDRVVAVTNLEGQVMTRSYDVGRLVASETRFDGTTVAYDYDTDANLSSVAYPGETLSFGYDADGLLTSASNSVGVVTNLYDASTGWLDASQGVDGMWVSYARSDGGAVTSMTSVAGTTAYYLDAAGRRMRLATPSAAFEFGYCGWNGRLAAVTNASGFVVQYAYDIMDRVTNISWRTTSGATLGCFAYEYDAVGRITSRSHALGDPSQPSFPSCSSQKIYAYDDFDRLATDDDVAYTYDAAGNRMTRTEDGDTITYTLGVGDHLASWTGGAYTHDAAGNVTRIERDGKPTLDLTWNSQYQLVSVSTNGVFAESHTYDALNRRVSTTTLEGTIHHVYDDNWQVIADINEDGSVVASYVWGEGIDNLLAVTIGGVTYYPLTDIQGTVWGYVDSQNNIAARWQYDAWGNVISEEVAPSAAVLAMLRYRFQGREWSAATGLINFRIRWYDTETGRWLSKDPIGLSGGLNLYAFCGNDIVNKKDPFGLRVYYDNGCGGHSTVFIEDPFGIGYWKFDFGPDKNGLKVLHGPSLLTLNPLPEQTKPSGMFFETSAADDFLALKAAFNLLNANLPYDLVFNNCAHMSRAVLKAAGLNLGNPIFDTPNRLQDDLKGLR